MSCGVAVDTFVGYWDAKAPGATLDYRFNWFQWLPAGDTIASATVTGATGINISNVVFTSTVVTFWVDGGTAGEEYDINCEITTNQSRTSIKYGTLRVEDATSS